MTCFRTGRNWGLKRQFACLTFPGEFGGTMSPILLTVVLVTSLLSSVVNVTLKSRDGKQGTGHLLSF